MRKPVLWFPSTLLLSLAFLSFLFQFHRSAVTHIDMSVAYAALHSHASSDLISETTLTHDSNIIYMAYRNRNSNVDIHLCKYCKWKGSSIKMIQHKIPVTEIWHKIALWYQQHHTPATWNLKIITINPVQIVYVLI